MPREPSPINDRASSYKDTSDVESPTGAARGGAFPAGKRAVSTTEAAASEPMTRCDRYILLFRQGLLPSMQTTLSPVTVMLTLMVVAALGIVLGVVVVMAADTAIEVKVRYDHVNQYKYPITSPDIARSANNGGVNFTAENRWFMQGMDVVVDFTVDKVMQPPIMLSYHLTNFYQNYRYYAASLNNLQLVGSSVAAVDLSLCAPLRSPSELRSEIESRSSIKINGQPFLYGDMVYLPCGAVPWSMFNDSITLYALDAQGVAVTGLICNASDFAPNGNRLTLSATQNACVKKGIAWPSDRAHRFLTEDWQFKTPTMWTGRGANTTDDEYLAHGWYAKEPGHKIPDPVDEDLMVWMRLATLPEFRKLHRMITAPILPGKYRLVVKEFFDSTSYSGSKSIMLSTFSWAGGKDYVLGYMLLGGGVAAMVLCGALFGRFMIRRASSDDGDNATEAPDDQRSVA